MPMHRGRCGGSASLVFVRFSLVINVSLMVSDCGYILVNLA
jgi:hypothetical protein